MKTLLDNIVMNNAYCEVTDCRDIESCEKCVELILAEHDKQIKADEKNKVIAKIKVKLGKVKNFEYETSECYRKIQYYNAKHVLKVLNNVLNEQNS